MNPCEDSSGLPLAHRKAGGRGRWVLPDVSQRKAIVTVCQPLIGTLVEDTQYWGERAFVVGEGGTVDVFGKHLPFGR